MPYPPPRLPVLRKPQNKPPVERETAEALMSVAMRVTDDRRRLRDFLQWFADVPTREIGEDADWIYKARIKARNVLRTLSISE